jgi:antirestriction protein ArdC
MVPIAFGSIRRTKGNKHMTRKTTRQNAADRVDVYEEVTAQIIAMLEAGTRPWSPKLGYRRCHPALAPRGHRISRDQYPFALDRRHDARLRQPLLDDLPPGRRAGRAGAQGRKGQSCVHAGTFTPKDGETGEPVTNSEGEEATRKFLKRYIVFNVEQIDGLDMSKYPVPRIEIKNRDQRDADLDEAFARWPVPYAEGGSSAYYDPAADRIQMPAFSDFESGNAFYATLAHEAVHSTGNAKRLARETLRDYGKSREIRAEEELIAEVGAAMVARSLAWSRPSAKTMRLCGLLVDRPAQRQAGDFPRRHCRASRKRADPRTWTHPRRPWPPNARPEGGPAPPSPLPRS